MRIMTHVVVGYPSLRESEGIVTALAEAGSEFIELQIPFSDPVADGPLIARANEVARRHGVTLCESLRFAKKMARKFPRVRFYMMSYYNPIFRFGLRQFALELKRLGVRGAIIPDLPYEEAEPLLEEFHKNELELVFVLAPNTPDSRLREITKRACGLVYCVARLGVTGKTTEFNSALKTFLTRVKKFTALQREAPPLGLAVGFGVASSKDVSAIKKAGGDIAVVGSALIRAHEKGGASAAGRLVRTLAK